MSAEAFFDVIVIGGGYVGMAAALQLVRARRRVVVIDACLGRNRFAKHSHGFLGQDGSRPEEMLQTARQQLQAYPSLTWVDGVVVGATGEKDRFNTALEDGRTLHGRRLLFATGVKDTLPAIAGLEERWGKSVFHCPYCHGYELQQGKIGLVAVGPASLHQAQLLPEWGEVTLLANSVEFDEAARKDLAERGLRIEDEPIISIEGVADVVLKSGRRLNFAGLFTLPITSPSTPVAETLGCEIAHTPFGTQLQTNDTKETTIPGVFACGDTARMPHSISLAVGDGAWAGAQVHRSFVWPTH
jgi:thioredoxin reductase